MTPAQLMTRLDGLMGSGLRAQRAPQSALLWRDLMRTIVFSRSLRNATDWELGAASNVIATSATGEIDSSGGTVYGFLVDSIYDETDKVCVMLTDGEDITFDGIVVDLGSDTVGLGDNLEGMIVTLPAASAITAAQIHGWTIPNGVILTTAIQFAANDDEGEDVVANDVRVYCVYRSDTEAHTDVM